MVVWMNSDMPVRFVRKYNRTVKDIFDNKFQNRVKMELQNVTQKIAYYCKHNHGFQNRTGALEESINFTPPVLKGDNWQSTVFAGGWARAKYAYQWATRSLKGQLYERRKRNIRYQRGESYRVRPGQGIWVNYAYWVEKRGYPVLIQGIEKFKGQIAKVFAAGLRVKRYPL